jgi:glycerol-3-phosphate acyltransferase PlsY
MLLTAGAFLLAVKISGHISVGSMTGAVALPIAAALCGAPHAFTAAAAGAGAMILLKHVSNVKRLLASREHGVHGAA